MSPLVAAFLLVAAVQLNGQQFGSEAEGCPDSFVRLGTGCYQVLKQGREWHDAPAACQVLDPRAQPAVLNNADNNEAVKDFLSSIPTADTEVCELYGYPQYWIAGIRDTELDCDSEFVWKPKYTGEKIPMTFHDWYSGEPNCLNTPGPFESCLELREAFGYKWNDLACDSKLCVLCEIPQTA